MFKKTTLSDSHSETLSAAGAEAVEAEGRNGRAPEETLFHHQRRRAAAGSTESDLSEDLWENVRAELCSRQTVGLTFVTRDLRLPLKPSGSDDLNVSCCCLQGAGRHRLL